MHSSIETPRIEIVAEGLQYPEGPIVCDDGSVIVCELRSKEITRIMPDGRSHHIAKIDGGPNGLAIGRDGAIYCCNNGGFAWEPGNPFPTGPSADYATGSIDRVDIVTGKVERLYRDCNGVQLAGPNDIVFAADGSFWFTDFGKVFDHYGLLGGLYHARADGSAIRRVAGNVALNGVGLSPGGETVYAAATYQRWILAYDARSECPFQGRGAMAGEIVAHYPSRRMLDSLAIEADGMIAQAVIVENAGISRIHPGSGRETTFAFPDVLTTNIAFGGADMQTAYVTMSATGKLARLRWPAPGLRLRFNI